MKTPLILFVFLSLLATSNLYALEGISIREAIHKAAQQQTLTQRIAKVYLALNDNLYEPKFYQERDAAIAQFQEQLDALRWYAPTDNIKAALKEVYVIWGDYKAIADWSINKEGSKKMLKMCDDMLYATSQLLLSYEAYAEQLDQEFHNKDMLTIIKLMEETGEQQMLTQRVMLFYLAVKQNIESGTAKRKLNNAINKYKETLDKLEGANINSQPINTELQTMKEDWAKLGDCLSKFNNDPAYITNMLLLADRLSTNADRIADLYEDLGVKLSVSKSINVAAYQNMLTQRIAKSYVAMTYDYSSVKYKRELLTCVDLFEDHIKSMTRSARTEEIKDAVGVVKTMWKNYKKLVTTWDNMDALSVAKVLEKGHVMMAACDKVAQEIEYYARTIPEYKAFFVKDNGDEIEEQHNIAHQIRLAGSQRMFSQRIAIYFVMNALKVDTRLSKQRLTECLAAYKANFQQMLGSNINTPKIAAALSETQKEWDIIEELCLAPQKESIDTVLEKTSELFNKLDALNLVYESHMDNLFMEN